MQTKRWVHLPVIAIYASAAPAQETVHFTNVNFDGTYQSALNTVIPHTFQSDFFWGGEILATWTVRPVAGQTEIFGGPRWDVQTSANQRTSWALGTQSQPGFTSFPYGVGSTVPRAGTRRFSPLGLSASPINLLNQRFDFRFFNLFDSQPGTPNGNWESVTFTFLPYTPVVPPIPSVGDGITAPNGYLDFLFFDGAPDFSERSTVGIYNAAGELVTRFNGNIFEDSPAVRIDVSTWAPGSYYMGFGDNTTEFENRFTMTDYVDLEVYSGNVFITNGSGDQIGRFGQSPMDGNIFWSGFTLIPAPGVGLALSAGMLALGARRRR